MLGLFSPKQMAAMICGIIENQLNKTINEFSLVYNDLNKSVYFVIEGKKYPYDNDLIIKGIQGILESKMEKTDVIELSVITFSKITDSCVLNIGYKDANGEKKQTEIKL